MILCVIHVQCNQHAKSTVMSGQKSGQNCTEKITYLKAGILEQPERRTDLKDKRQC